MGVVSTRSAVAVQATELEQLELAVRRGEPRIVHRLRVATRRLLSALAVLVPPSSDRTAAVAGLETLAEAVGRVRDLDVLDAAVRRRGRRSVDPGRGGLSQLRGAIATEHGAALAGLLALLDGTGHRAVRLRLNALVPASPGDETVRRLKLLLHDFQRAGRKAAARPKPRRLHRVRLRGKQLRYALEVAGAAVGPAGRRLLDRLERLQVVLGKGQDARAQIDWLRSRAPQLTAAAAFVAGEIAQWLARDLRRARRGFPGRWQAIDRPRRWRALRRELRHGASHRCGVRPRFLAPTGRSRPMRP